MQRNVETGSNAPNFTDMQWWASSVQNWVKAPINAIGGVLNGETSWGTDWKSNKQINEEIKAREAREQALSEYYTQKKKSAEDFKRWASENPDKKSYGDMIDGQNIKDTTLTILGLPKNENEGIMVLGVIGLGLLVVINIFK